MCKALHFIFLLLFAFTTQHLNAQFTSAAIGINGLTCSQCSRSVEMSLKRLDAIANVDMDLQGTIAHLTFKKGKDVDFDKVAQAVRDAGFAVRNIVAKYHLSNPSNEGCFVDRKKLYYAVDNKANTPINSISILLLGKGMISESERKKYSIKNANATPHCKTNEKITIPFLYM